MFFKLCAKTLSIALLVSLFISLCLTPARGQAGPTVDELFAEARKQAFDGNRKGAREICAAILEKSPSYYDARILLGRLYSWDGEYELARKELKMVVESSPNYRDARNALIDVELWSGNPRDALKYSEEGLDRDPGNETFLYKKARALKALDDMKAATVTVRKLLELHPNNGDAHALLKSLEEADRPYKMTVDYSFDAFDKTFDPWHQLSLSLSRHQSFGSLIGRINYASRFSRSAVQYEVDAYPRIREGTYAYLNFGYSSSTIFPKYRLGAEVHQNLSRGLEASLGLRRLHFSSGDVNIYTGSLGKYYGNYWFSFRPFITPSDIGASRSGNLTIRRYFRDAEDYITLILGAGSSPDERYTTLDQYRLKSQKMSLEFRKKLGRGVIGTPYFSFANQEIGFDRSRKRYTYGFSIEKYF